jgi:PKD repeat protein
MRYSLIIGFIFSTFLLGCRKETIHQPDASFSFRGDTSSVIKMATYDTCTLFNSSINADSSFWDLGNGEISTDKNLVLTYPNSGTYTIKLTVKTPDGQNSSIEKTVIVLNRVLEKIIINHIQWDTVSNSNPNFICVWPTSPMADVFVLVQKYEHGDSIVPISGIMPNSEIIYQSPVIQDVSYRTYIPFVIGVPEKVVVDKQLVLDGSFVISLMAKDEQGVIYALQTSKFGGSTFYIREENFANNKFTLVSSLTSSLEFDCKFE